MELLFRAKKKGQRFTTSEDSWVYRSAEKIHWQDGHFGTRYKGIIIPDTISLYIQRCDQSNTRLFQNDIILFEVPDFSEGLTVIEWSNSCYGFTSKYHGSHMMDPATKMYLIGNVFDTPHLIPESYDDSKRLFDLQKKKLQLI